MFSKKKGILQIVERFACTGSTSNDLVKVTCLPNGKTCLVEQSGEDACSILLDEYRMDGKVIWAAYSRRTGTVYLSTAA
jgi:hypothetical protein